ncbi:MAG: hypothetical protein EOM24_10185 [Chloroflexia bacterium]|nr:hypothetical protein [Chloroflexia bacterium]
MNQRIHWRNATVATFVIVALFLAVTAPFTSSPLSAQTAITVDPPTPAISVAPGGTNQILITVTNNNIPGAVDRSFTLAFSNIPTGIQIAPSGTTFIAVGSSQQIGIAAAVANTVVPGVYTIAGIITGTAAGQTNVTQSIFLQLTVIRRLHVLFLSFTAVGVVPSKTTSSDTTSPLPRWNRISTDHAIGSVASEHMGVFGQASGSGRWSGKHIARPSP